MRDVAVKGLGPRNGAFGRKLRRPRFGAGGLPSQSRGSRSITRPVASSKTSAPAVANARGATCHRGPCARRVVRVKAVQGVSCSMTGMNTDSRPESILPG